MQRRRSHGNGTGSFASCASAGWMSDHLDGRAALTWSGPGARLARHPCEDPDAPVRTGTDAFATFVVRLSPAVGGRFNGIVERVRTGEKVRVHDLRALGAVIADMLADDEQPGPHPD